MAKLSKRSLTKVLSEGGLEVKILNSSHLGIFNRQGRKVYTTAFSPSDSHAWDQCVRDLVKFGHLPQSFKGRKIR